MILDAHGLILGYPFVARRHRRAPLCDALAVVACCQRASSLAQGVIEHEPAAMFFAFAEHKGAFPFAWKLMAAMIAHRQALFSDLVLKATPDELGHLCDDVFDHKATWEHVRGWFATRLAEGLIHPAPRPRPRNDPPEPPDEAS